LPDETSDIAATGNFEGFLPEAGGLRQTPFLQGGTCR
jgi:hypothetical protein